MKLFSLSITTGPTISCSTSFFRNEYIFRVIEGGIGTRLYSIDDLDDKCYTLGSKSTRIDLGI
jgi:hypothetical protein